MPLLKSQIIKAIQNKEIVFDGVLENIGSNSIDVTLNNKIKTYVPCKIITITKNGKRKNKLVPEKLSENFFISMSEKNKVYEYIIPDNGLIIVPGVLYLGSTIEVAGSSCLLPMYEGRSSTARLGLQSHLSAGFGDVGFQSNWTLEIIVVHPLEIFPNIRIGQVFFEEVDKEALNDLIETNSLYNSKYSNQPEAQESKMYLDFDENGIHKNRN
jgi:dCTP deaminase